METSKRDGTVKGQPLRYIHGHNAQRQPNLFLLEGSKGRIALRTNAGLMWTTVDAEDLQKLLAFTWGVRNKYAYHHSTEKGKRVSFYLHEVVLDRVRANDGQVVDHINRDRMDNRRANLRVVSKALNSHNSEKRNKSGLRGASPNIERGKYVAQVKMNYRTIPLGRYATAEEAHRVTMDYLREHRLVP